MYGIYDSAFHFEYNGIIAELERKDGFLIYRRTCGDTRVERVLASSGDARIIINPVEPLNLPKEITNYLMIEFDSIFVEPYSTKRIYLKFPVEIGVLVEGKQDMEVLDIFCSGFQKYTLYGSASTGLIARWYKSEIYLEIPEVDPLRDGIIELNITNAYREWVEVSRVVFESCDMKLYYGSFVGMVAQMKLLSKYIAETDFIDRPVIEGMRKSVELYKARKVPVLNKGFLMEWGLN